MPCRSSRVLFGSATARVQQRPARGAGLTAQRAWRGARWGLCTLGFVAGSLYQLVEEAEAVAAVAVGEGSEEAEAVAAVAVGGGCYTAHASQRRGHCGWGPRAHGPAGSTPGPCAHGPPACGGGLTQVHNATVHGPLHTAWWAGRAAALEAEILF